MTSTDNISDQARTQRQLFTSSCMAELSMKEPDKRIEFQRIHHLGKPNVKSPRPILARFLRYSDRQEVLKLARSKLRVLTMLCMKIFPRSCTICVRPKCPNLRRQSEEAQKRPLAKHSPTVYLLAANLSQQTNHFLTFHFVVVFIYSLFLERAFRNYAKAVFFSTMI